MKYAGLRVVSGATKNRAAISYRSQSMCPFSFICYMVLEMSYLCPLQYNSLFE